MLTAAIIGAGAIAIGSRSHEPPMTHLDSYTALKHDVRLTAFAEKDRKQRQVVADRLPHLKPYEDFEDLLSHEKVDIVSICIPDYLHGVVLRKVLNYSTKGIWCEKPFAATKKEAHNIVRMAEEKNVILQVNYWRRFIVEMIELREQIAGNQFGRIHAITGYYADKYIHNGSHLVDLIHFLVGKLEPICAKVYGPLDQNDDGPVMIAAEAKNKIHCVLQPIPRNRYNLFELNIFCETARVRITENGRRVEIYYAKKDRAFPHLRILKVVPTISRCNWRSSFENALSDLIDCINDHSRQPLSGGRSASECVDVLEKVSQLGIKELKK